MRWIALLLVPVVAAHELPEAEVPAAPVLAPGDDHARLQALGWVGPWEVVDGTVLLRIEAPAGAAWTADDVLRVRGATAYEAHVDVPWRGALEPDALGFELWGGAGPCLRLDLLAAEGDGVCQGENRMRLWLALPPGATGDGAVTLSLRAA